MSMNDAFGATLIGIILLLVTTMAIFLGRCATSMNMEPLLDARYDKISRGANVHAAAVLLGWLAFVGVGILGLLRLGPMLSSDVRWGLAVTGALLSIGALRSFDALPERGRRAVRALHQPCVPLWTCGGMPYEPRLQTAPIEARRPTDLDWSACCGSQQISQSVRHPSPGRARRNLRQSFRRTLAARHAAGLPTPNDLG